MRIFCRLLNSIYRSHRRGPVLLLFCGTVFFTGCSTVEDLLPFRSKKESPAEAKTAVKPQTPQSRSVIELARELVEQVTPENNEYATNPSFILWRGENGEQVTKNRTVCSTLLTQLLQKSHALDNDFFKDWTDSISPDPPLYLSLIETENKFLKRNSISEWQVGDVVAIEYPTLPKGITGHIVLVDSPPRLMSSQAQPSVEGTLQYEVSVIDSSQTGRGPLDTRRQSDGSWVQGVGRGSMRFYTDLQGRVVGYTWSTYSTSTFYSIEERPFATGKFQK